MTTPLRLRLRALREAQGRDQHEIAADIGVCQATISSWENKRRTPRTRHAVAWATSLHHQLVVTRKGHLVGELQRILPHLAPLRRTLGYPSADVARSLHVISLSNIESRAARGRDLELITLTRYLAAIGCRIDIQPNEVTSC